MSKSQPQPVAAGIMANRAMPGAVYAAGARLLVGPPESGESLQPLAAYLRSAQVTSTTSLGGGP